MQGRLSEQVCEMFLCMSGLVGTLKSYFFPLPFASCCSQPRAVRSGPQPLCPLLTPRVVPSSSKEEVVLSQCTEYLAQLSHSPVWVLVQIITNYIPKKAARLLVFCIQKLLLPVCGEKAGVLGRGLWPRYLWRALSGHLTGFVCWC